MYRRFPSFKQQLRRFVDCDVRERPLESDYLYAPQAVMDYDLNKFNSTLNKGLAAAGGS